MALPSSKGLQINIVNTAEIDIVGKPLLQKLNNLRKKG